jgi:hypothetical protein
LGIHPFEAQPFCAEKTQLGWRARHLLAGSAQLQTNESPTPHFACAARILARITGSRQCRRRHKRILQDSKRKSAMSFNSFFRSACITVVFLLVTIVRSVNAIAQTGYFDHSESSRLTRLWIPADAETVRRILIIGNGAGGDSTRAAFSSIYQRFGELHRFVVIGTAVLERW